MQELISRFGKSLWLVSNPAASRGPGDVFSLLYGTNAPIRPHSFKGFHPVYSREGQEILRVMKNIVVGQQLLPGFE